MVCTHILYIMVMNKNISISKPLLEKDVFVSMSKEGYRWSNGLESCCMHV